jgi:GTPase SAR1 family protein
MHKKVPPNYPSPDVMNLVNYAKIVILGDRGVGKTALLKGII